mgnify:CR=1 FL=1
MPAVFEYQHQVTEAEIDGVGHVNNLAYLRWMQDAAVAHSAAQGWPAKAYYDLGQGWVVRSHFIEYLVPAFAGDEIVVRTWVAAMNFYEMVTENNWPQPSQTGPLSNFPLFNPVEYLRKSRTPSKLCQTQRIACRLDIPVRRP